MRTLFALGIVGLLYVHGMAAQADTPPGSTATVGSHKVTITGDIMNYNVLLDGKSVIHDTESFSDSIAGTYIFPDFSVVLIAEGDDGNACEFAFFKALIISNGGYSVVDQFGGCGPAKISKTNNSVVISGIGSNTPTENQVFTITKSGLVTTQTNAPPPNLIGPDFTPGMDLGAVAAAAHDPVDPLMQKAVSDRITQLYGANTYQQLSTFTMTSEGGTPYQDIDSFEVNFLGEPHGAGDGAYLVFDHIGDVWVGMFTVSPFIAGPNNSLVLATKPTRSIKWLGNSPPPPAVIAAAKAINAY